MIRKRRDYETRFATFQGAIDTQCSFRAVSCQQPLPQGAQAKLVRLSYISAASRSVIPNRHAQPAILARAAYPYRTAFRADGNGVQHRILSRCLHGKRGHVEFTALRVNMQIDPKRSS